MKKKYIKYIIIIVILILIIFGGIKLFSAYQEEKRITAKLVNEIKNNYTIVEDSASKYNEVRENLSKNLNTYYQDDFQKNYDEIRVEFDNYELIMKELKTSIDNINKDCVGYIYKDRDANHICKDYRKMYEEMVNVYINDIKSFNKIIDKYNEDTNNNLEKYKSNLYSDYIDFDKDGVYSGK